jgi:hypothetical protein
VLNRTKICRSLKVAGWRGAIALVSLSICFTYAPAQEARTAAPSVRGGDSTGADHDASSGRLSSEWGVWAGGPLFVRSTRKDRSDDGRMYILGVSFARDIAVRRSYALTYTADVIPLVLLSHPRPEGRQGEGSPASGPLQRSIVRGTGLAPIGFKFNFRPRSRTQPFLDLKFGFVTFNEKIPTDRGTQFNFTAQSGGGVQVLTGLRTSFTLGSRFHHISNGGRGLTNPGFNTVMLYTAFSIRR